MINQRCTTLLLLALGLLVSAAATAGGRNPDLEILVMVRQGAIILPNASAVVLPAAAGIRDSNLRSALTRANIVLVSRACPNANPDDMRAAMRNGATRLGMDMSQLYRLQVVREDERSSVISMLEQSPDVIFAERNQRVELRSVPNDPDFRYQWALQNIGQSNGVPGFDIGATQAWNTTTGYPLVRIGIIDLGVDATHPEFGGRVTGQTGTSNHATEIASIAAATGGNGTGMAGIVWNVPIISEVFDPLDMASVHDAIVRAVDAGCQVINVSWGVYYYSKVLEDGIAYAYRNGVLVVTGMPETQRIGDYPNKFQYLGVLNVGATQNTGAPASYSLPASYLDVMAPGGTRGQDPTRDIYAAGIQPVYAYGYVSGTSMAAPHAVGAAALLASDFLSRGSVLHGNDLRGIIRASAIDMGSPGFDDSTGYGELNARRMIDQAHTPYFNYRTAVGGTDVGSSGLYSAMIYNVPGLSPGGYNVRVHEIQKFIPTPVPYAWGLETTTGWPRIGPELPSTERSLLNTGWCEPVPGSFGPTGFTMRTYIYEVYTPLNQWKGWYPCQASQVVYQWTYYAPTLAPSNGTPDLNQSFYVPEAGSVATPTVGTAATALFRACPNNDGGASLPNSVRIRVVLRDAQGLPIQGVEPAAIYALFNGGTAAQGFASAGADSVIANSLYNVSPACPDVRTLEADVGTDQLGMTYITFTGATSSNPGAGVRDAGRKWGHYDSDIPVYASGVRLMGRLTENDVNGSYVLQIKNFDFEGGLGTAMNQGELVSLIDYNSLSAHVGQSDADDPKNWWRDFNSDGSVTVTDLNALYAHLNHDCATPNNP